jgi:hypothetical protein
MVAYSTRLLLMTLAFVGIFTSFMRLREFRHGTRRVDHAATKSSIPGLFITNDVEPISNKQRHQTLSQNA